MSDYTYMVVVMEDYYPSVHLFENAEGAREKFNALQVEDDSHDDKAVFIGEIKDFKGLFWKEEVEW